MKHIDLHLHTIYSDGTAFPRQVVVDCATLGLDAIAITDHDITKGYKQAKEEGEKWGLEVLTGVEITATKYHILGYDFDVENRALQDILEYSRECQEDITKKRIEKLIAYGVPITFEKVKNCFSESRLGKLNIFMTMLKDKECRQYNKDKSPDKLLKFYLQKGGVAYEIEDKKRVIEKEAINTIHEAGGLAIVAHPSKDAETVEDLKELKGIDGLEIQPNFLEKNKVFKAYAEEKNLIITYGSDYHGARVLKRPLIGRKENLVKQFWR